MATTKSEHGVQCFGKKAFAFHAVMPARVALTDVPVWELVLSAALLIAGAMLARRAAGKVFSVAMLMYGKEPSWREIRRWVRES